MSAGRRTLGYAVGALIVLALPFWLSPNWLTAAVFVLVAAIGVSGLNVLTGFAGQISLGHAFFMATGAYAYVLVAEWTGSAIAGVLAAVFVAAALGAASGPIALRVSGFYLAIVTLGLVFIGQHVLFNVDAISGGPAGRTFPSLNLFGVDFATDFVAIGPFTIDPNALHYYLFALVLLVVTILCRNIATSRQGRAFNAVRERPDVAESMGVKLALTKVSAFTFSSAIAGLGGALFVAYIGYAQPGQWDLHLSVQYVAALIVGGMGTIAGPTLGAIVVFGLPTVLSQLADAVGSTAPTGAVSSVVYGTLIVLFLTFEPHGVVGLGHRVSTAGRSVAKRSVLEGPDGENRQHPPPTSEDTP